MNSSLTADFGDSHDNPIRRILADVNLRAGVAIGAADKSPAEPGSKRESLFDETNWGLIKAAQAGDTSKARSALAELCETYWYPLYAFIRRKGYATDRIETLVILKRYDQVLSSCDAYLAREKPTAEILGIRSLALLGRRDYACAIADLTRAIALRPAPEPVILTRLLNRRGLAYHLADAPRLARDDFESSLQLDKDQSDALAGRGLARIRLGQWRPAVADAEAAVRLVRALPTPDQDPNVLAQTFINAALIYAQAVEYAAREVSREGERAVTLYRRYHSRSLELLQSGLQQIPDPARRQKILNDPALKPLRLAPGRPALSRLGVSASKGTSN